MSYGVLTEDQAEQFLDRGYVKVEGCFEKSAIRDWIDLAFERLGYDPDDPATWEEPRVHLPSMNDMDVADFAPKAWGAICDVMGGEDRIK